MGPNGPGADVKAHRCEETRELVCGGKGIGVNGSRLLQVDEWASSTKNHK